MTNLYFLVEGKKSEAKVYPAWLSYLLPELQRVSAPDEVDQRNYYFVSAEGYPSIIYQHTPNAVEDIRLSGRYQYLVVCLDAEEQTVQEVRDEVSQFFQAERIELGNTQLVLIVQNRCIETWFLGNRRIYSRNPQHPALASYTRYYNVSANDPELMSKYRDFNTHAQFHSAYLKALFTERNISYSKNRPGHVLDQRYFDQLLARIRAKPQHLSTFRNFIEFCSLLRPKLYV